MNFTVIQRVAGGFALLIVLLLALSVTSYNALSTISNHLRIVTQEATPMVITSGEMTAALLSSGNTISSYHVSSNENKLQVLQKQYNNYVSNYTKYRNRLKSLAHNSSNVLAAIKKEQIFFQEYSDKSTQLFQEHKKSVQLGAEIVNDVAVWNSILLNSIHEFVYRMPFVVVNIKTKIYT